MDHLETEAEKYEVCERFFAGMVAVKQDPCIHPRGCEL